MNLHKIRDVEQLSGSDLIFSRDRILEEVSLVVFC